MTRDELRRKLQQTRTQLSEANRRDAAAAVCARVAERIKEANGGVAAIFNSFGGELDTRPCIESFWERGITTALPVLHPFSPGHLLFLRYNADTPMKNNRFGIAEPCLNCQNVIPLSDINWLFMPLVGFDQHGNRIGMGGGYYDRTLAQWRKGLLPTLQPIGLAYDEQQVEHIPYEPWDVPLPEVITPTKHWRF